MKVKKRGKDAPKTIFSVQDYMGFALSNSELHFNDAKIGHAGIFSEMGLDVGIHSHILLLGE